MRLTRLHLVGYKSFANKTEFAFPEGITAIVGPNGSGKSNVADALRWVLGEQSQSALRAKRTEDLIFAGSNARSRQGMAEVAITLDNADATLPIDFTEVTITRRAYRSGESEYVLNGARVRLRDVLELLAHSDLSRSTYVVIGQGLVDQALALRPDERRQLIDEAAGLRPYQAKREMTLTRLEETEANLQRVQDVLAEINPRVQRLERHAERAYEYARLSAHLQEALVVWHGYHWHRTREECDLARLRAADRAHELAQVRDELAALQADLASLRADGDRKRADVGTWRRQTGELRARYEDVRRSLAVGRERMSLLGAQRDEMRAETEGLAEQQAATRAALAEEECTLTRLAETRAQHAAEAEALRLNLADLEAQRQTIRRALAATQQRMIDLAVRLADRQSRLTQLAERRATLVAETEELAAGVTWLQEDLAASQSEANTLQAAADAAVAQLNHAVEAARARRADLANAGSQEARLEDALRRAERALQSLVSRRQVLGALRRELGDVGTVSDLIAQSLPEWKPVGRVAELIRVPAELEGAVEAALGPWLYALVVEGWSDAVRALAVLRKTEAGRASLVPLDTLRSPAEDSQLPYPLAAQVACDDRFRPLVAALLGDVVLTEDLTAARALLDSGDLRFRCVTPAGEVVEPGGGVTAGQADGGQALAWEREWRSLPVGIEAATVERDQLASQLEAARQRRRALGLELSRLEKSVAEHEADQRRRQLSLDGAQHVFEKRDRDLGWRRDLLAKRRAELAELAGQTEKLTAEQRELELAQAALRVESERYQADADRLAGDDLLRASAEMQAALAGLQREHAAQQARLKLQQEAVGRLEQQLAARKRRLNELDGELEALRVRIASRVGEEQTLGQELARLEARMSPAEDALDEMTQRERELDTAASQLRGRVLVAESAHSEGTSEVRRAEERFAQLRSEIRADLDLVASGRHEHILQLALDLPDELSRLPYVTVMPEGLDAEVQDLKRQIRALGPVDPALLAEYETALERAKFLAGQLEDLRKADQDLRQIIVELDRAIRQRFDETFEIVADRFAHNFTELFGGGSARLARVEADRPQPESGRESPAKPGIEIVARPPGKRSQPLSLLSGGERALSAVALIFALLEVSRTPFCLLDEVDAMLDEANIGRFRQALERLAQQTQIVVITHNRGTVQAANTLYGVSMDEHAVSQVVSLKLDDAA